MRETLNESELERQAIDEQLKKKMVENMQRSLKRKKDALTYGVKKTQSTKQVDKPETPKQKQSAESLDLGMNLRNDDQQGKLDSLTAGLNRLMRKSTKTRSLEKEEESLENTLMMMQKREESERMSEVNDAESRDVLEDMDLEDTLGQNEKGGWYTGCLKFI